MAKWLVLAAGVFLFFNGMTARTYSYTDPAKYCFQMDYVRIYGCFSNSATPTVIAWGAVLIGGGLIILSVIRGRRQNVS